ncbi:isoprenylcysteine carboxylmethyltransferase family protein [Fibrobacter sp. UWB12]|uniref:methyltransferase family protein n=1 Tax=Fibrobacter sp. UWB12 TaxID=1896203 RepID=UPI0009114E7C|nr:isoprenylcysteine carboxylmethyltransferase family protein [Fibrobacter sp. UWB12]SHK87230.1 Protein-S-isoprenylcysteine O-methyltransferase Ste14 [Fibrobacter sp. UWB12]
MPSAKHAVSTFMYRFRGYILGVIAVALVCAPPSLFPEQFCINDCIVGVFVASLLYVASALLRVRSRQFIGEHTRGYVHDADALVTCGPYSLVRHPLYISNTGFALGVAFFHLGASLWTVPFMVVVIAFEVFLSQIEDRFLEQKFGDVWRAWALKTPAVLPRLSVSRAFSCDSVHVPPQRTFWQAFFADSSTWLWLLFCNLLLVLRKLAAFYV